MTKKDECFADPHDGHLERLPSQDPKTGAVYSGEMNCDVLRFPFVLIQAGAKRNDRSPDFIVKAINKRGELHRWGAAWLGDGEVAGRFINIKFQHPKHEKEGIDYRAWQDDIQPKDWVEGEEPVFFHINWKAPRQGAADDYDRDGFAGMVGEPR